MCCTGCYAPIYFDAAKAIYSKYCNYVIRSRFVKKTYALDSTWVRPKFLHSLQPSVWNICGDKFVTEAFPSSPMWSQMLHIWDRYIAFMRSYRGTSDLINPQLQTSPHRYLETCFRMQRTELYRNSDSARVESNALFSWQIYSWLHYCTIYRKLLWFHQNRQGLDGHPVGYADILESTGRSFFHFPHLERKKNLIRYLYINDIHEVAVIIANASPDTPCNITIQIQYLKYQYSVCIYRIYATPGTESGWSCYKEWLHLHSTDGKKNIFVYSVQIIWGA